jgi:hypothetical protein
MAPAQALLENEILRRRHGGEELEELLDGRDAPPLLVASVGRLRSGPQSPGHFCQGEPVLLPLTAQHDGHESGGVIGPDLENPVRGRVHAHAETPVRPENWIARSKRPRDERPR